jgi:hypothetical protein
MLGEGQVLNVKMPHARSYVCYRAAGPVMVDGDIDKAAWAPIPWTEDFVDILGDRKLAPRFRTRAKMMWDDANFYVAAELEEPHVWGTIKEKNAVIFYDNDFEVFIDPDGDNHNYYEFEVNALNTIWELTLPKPYRAGGPAKLGTNLPGLKSGVMVDGTLNDPSGTDKRWCVEVAFPFAELAGCLGERLGCPPNDGDVWRVAMSRVEWLADIIHGKYIKVPGREEDNWLWTPQPAVDAHRPWTWGYVKFSSGAVNDVDPYVDEAWGVKMLLMDIYDAQRLMNLPAVSLGELGLSAEGIEGLLGDVTIELTETGWHAAGAAQYADGSTRTWHTREDSKLWCDGG